MIRSLRATSLVLILALLGSMGCSSGARPALDRIAVDEASTTIDADLLPASARAELARGSADLPFGEIERIMKQPVAPELDAAEMARLVHEAVNDARQHHGHTPYAWADSLAQVATLHSRNMAERDFFAHNTPDGRTVNDRAHEAGLHCQRQLDGDRTALGFGENLAMQTQYARVRVTFAEYDPSDVRRIDVEWNPLPEIVRSAVDGWLQSDGHRQNLLSEDHAHHGVGIARSSDKVVYITQVLC